MKHFAIPNAPGGESEIEMIEFAFAACRRAVEYAATEDRIGLATAAALLRCEVAERIREATRFRPEAPEHDLYAPAAHVYRR